MGRVVVNALSKLQGDLKGEYYGLCGSQSQPRGKPCAMDHAKEEKLRNNGNLFQEPDSTLLLSSGCGRHWPDARGIFHNDAENFFVWVNEEDQMRIVSMEKGDNIHAIFQRFANATKALQESLKKMGLQARGTSGVDSASSGGTWDISNSDRLGKSEVQLCNLFIEGVAQVIRWEKALEEGKNIDAEVAEAKPLGI